MFSFNLSLSLGEGVSMGNYVPSILKGGMGELRSLNIKRGYGGTTFPQY